MYVRQRERERVKLNSKWVCVSLSVVVWWDKVQWRVCRCEEHRWRHISVPLGARMSWAILENERERERERERSVCERRKKRERFYKEIVRESRHCVCERERHWVCVIRERQTGLRRERGTSDSALKKKENFILGKHISRESGRLQQQQQSWRLLLIRQNSTTPKLDFKIGNRNWTKKVNKSIYCIVKPTDRRDRRFVYFVSILSSFLSKLT